MAVLSEGEMLLKEQVELQKGISHTNDEFKTMLASSKQYQQMLRVINRQLVEHNSLYGQIREENEKLFDKVLEFSKIVKDKKLSDAFNNIYKDVNKISDEFRDLNAKLQTGDVSLKEYKKSFDKLGNVQNIINRQETIFTKNRDNLQKEYDLTKDLYEKKYEDYVKVGKRTQEQLKNSLDIQLQSRIQHENKISKFIFLKINKKLNSQLDQRMRNRCLNYSITPNFFGIGLLAGNQPGAYSSGHLV